MSCERKSVRGVGDDGTNESARTYHVQQLVLIYDMTCVRVARARKLTRLTLFNRPMDSAEKSAGCWLDLVFRCSIL